MERLKAAMAVLLCLILSTPSASALAQAAPAAASQSPAARQAYQSGELRGDDRILQALNRFTFGTRPGDLEAVRAMGVEKWFTQQLHPESIDQSDLQARLAQFPAMQWSTQDLLVRLPSNAMIRQAADGKVPVPEHGALHAVYVDEIARYENRQQQKAQKQQQATLTATAAMTVPANGAQPNGTQQSMAPEAVQPVAVQADAGQTMAVANAEPPPPDEAKINRILALPPAQRVAQMVAMTQPDFDSFRKALKGPQRNALNADLNPAQKEVVGALENPQRMVNDELMAQRLTRDIYSNTQLREVMADFWLNHFNVYLHKNDETPYYLVSYERDVIRPRALG
jgi:hypothetical protein